MLSSGLGGRRKWRGSFQIRYTVRALREGPCPCLPRILVFKHSLSVSTCKVNMFPMSFISISSTLMILMDQEIFPGGSGGKESACNAGDLGLIPELGRSPGEGHVCNPLQCSCL